MNDETENDLYSCIYDITHELYDHDLKMEMNNGINFLYININCLKNKLNKMESFLSQLKVLVHVIILVEINLKENEMKFFNFANYNCYHSCRKGKTYGGVAMYVHNSIRSQLIVSEQFCFANFLTVELIDLNCKVAGIYNPPDTNKMDFIDYFANYLDDKKKCYIFGDFNINLMDSDSHVVSSYRSMVEASGFSILNKISNEMYTRRSNTVSTLIDHVMADFLTDKFILYTGDLFFSDHRFLLFNVQRTLQRQSTEVIKKVDYCKMRDEFARISLDDDVSFDDFHSRLVTAAQQSCKDITVTRKFDSYHKPWFRDELRPYMKYRDQYYKLKVKYPLNDYY
jgi:exonuclease III